MAQHFFEVGAFSLRCSELTSQTAVYEFEEMIKAMEDDAIIAATLADKLKEFEPAALGDIASDLSLAPGFIVKYLKTANYVKKSSFFYTPVYSEPPFVPEAGIYFGIKASQEKAKELSREWALGDTEQFMTNNVGAVKSSVAPQWVYLMSMQNFKSIDIASIFPSEDQERIGKTIPELIPDRYGVSHKVFQKLVIADKTISFDELDMLVRSSFCTLDRDALSPYHTFYKKTDEGKGWGIKYHDVQEEFPQGDVTVLNPVFNPKVQTMVIDVVLWQNSVTQGELCKVGFYYQEDGTKVLNIVPPFPAAKTAIKKDDWVQRGTYSFEEMVIKEYLPCHFQSDSLTISQFLSASM